MSEKNETVEEYNFKNRQEWQKALDAAPKNSWIKERNLGRKKSLYIPLAVQQALADIFFNECDVIDASFQVVVNEILCTVKISVLPSYPNSEHRIISGSGAKPIQASSGSIVSKFPRGKITNSLEYCSPAARAAAISNALTTFANIFGRNIGREEISSNYSMRGKDRKKPKKSKKNGKDKKG